MPLSSQSIKSRFTVSIIVNTLRASLVFLTHIIAARALEPTGYGTFAFLSGSFVAVRMLLDMGTSQAFFTFLSQRPRDLKFLAAYGAWLTIQFLLPLVVISLILPQSWLDEFWQGNEKELILLAFAAIFSQQQIWNGMILVGESRRQTQRVQAMTLIIAAVDIILVTGAWLTDWLSVARLFQFMIAEHFAALIAMYYWLDLGKTQGEAFVGSHVLKDYWVYCSPLILYSFISFGHEFADRWLLQNFGGSSEQAFFSVGQRFAMISLLATVSMLRIFWKEIAEAQEQGNLDRVRYLYHKVSRFLYAGAALLTGFLVPWSRELIEVLVGPAYIESAPVVALMFLFPVHQTLSHLNGSLMLASGRTRAHLVFNGTMMACSIPISYWVQAAPSEAIPGLGLGALGMACKVVVINLVMTNFMSWWLARQYHWPFDWQFQVILLGGSLGLGFGVHQLVQGVTAGWALPVWLIGGGAFLLHLLLCGFLIYRMPQLAGLTRSEIQEQIEKVGRVLGGPS